MNLMDDINFNKYTFNLSNKEQIVNVIQYQQNSSKKTLLISKLSEAILPNTIGNTIGDGSFMDDIFNYQKNIKFIINAGFSHYRKNFYDWKHQDYNIGDPVGFVKIREHVFIDYINSEYYGYFVQKDKISSWEIKKSIENIQNYKYVLGCTPLLTYNYQPLEIPDEIPVKKGKINPPSYLGHGAQCHPRTAVGIKDDIIYFINVENNCNNDGGCTLNELQQIGLELKLESLLNLDGGGSSQFRLLDSDGKILSNYVSDEDRKRVLGHALILFDN